MTRSAPCVQPRPPTTTPGDTTWTRLEEGWLLTLTGEHDLTTARELEHQMQQVSASSAKASVVIDLSKAAFIDYQVIAWLVRWSDHARRSGDLRVSVATGEVSAARRLIDLVGSAGLVPCHATTAEAFAAIGCSGSTRAG